ncbi:hypothetical protein DPMN_026497 [Dreissena polymorpha]|uniref:Uncharacterized protein n=1 Tax=Dreissena polymorpha TaxID=45954 RepID=A0A9D4LTH4_DREPO|nr:hypothetical protein DPMN_026497 [Dreissena polymorpha]
MRKIEGCFSAKELLETRRAKSLQATQNAGESLEDWADRVLPLETPAYAKPSRKAQYAGVNYKVMLGLYRQG